MLSWLLAYNVSYNNTPPLAAAISWLFSMIWYDMIWYDMIWYDMIWYDMVWYDMIWYGMIWYDMIWYDMIWYDMIWYDMIWYDMIWYDMIWYDMIWYYPLCNCLIILTLYCIINDQDHKCNCRLHPCVSCDLSCSASFALHTYIMESTPL